MAGTDAQKAGIWYRTDTYPVSRNDSVAHMVDVWNVSDAGLNTAVISDGFSSGTCYYFSLFVGDTAGNWSAVRAGAQDTACTFSAKDTTTDTTSDSTGTVVDSTGPVVDTAAPVNDLAVSLETAGDTAVTVELRVGDSVHSPGISRIQWGYVPLDAQTYDSAGLFTGALAYHDTVFTVYDMAKPGAWQFGFTLQDSAGHLSETVLDTVTIANLAPRLTISGDTLLDEDMSWQAQVSGYDANGDSLVYRLIDKPSPSFTLSGTTLRWTPGQNDVGTHVIRVECSDTHGDTAQETLSVRVQEVNDAPVTVIHTDVAYGALAISLHAQDDKDSLFTYHFTVKREGKDSLVASGSETTRRMNRSIYPLGDGSYVCEAWAVDREGMQDSVPATATVTVRNATEMTFGAHHQWNMVGIPAREPPVSQLKKSGVISVWDESRPPRDIYSYYTPCEEITSLHAGQGLWHRADSSTRIVLSYEQLLDTACTMHLYNTQYGWNQVTSPYTYPVRWHGEGTLWQWDSLTQGVVPVKDTLLPWRGYWVRVARDTSYVLDPTPCFVKADGLGKRAGVQYTHGNEWRIRLDVRTPQGRDYYNILGFSKKASDRRDSLDIAKPPSMGTTRTMFFYHDEWKENGGKFATDIRHTCNTMNTFTVGFTPGAHRAEVRVEGIEEVVSMYLYIASPDTMVRMDAGDVYTVSPSSEVVYRTIFIAKDPQLTKKIPLRFSLGTAHPNPFGPMVRISYTLPYRWKDNGLLDEEPYVVRLNIIDGRGRIIRNLVYGKRTPGTYDIVWYGKTNAGNIVGSGMYFYKCEAGGYSRVRRVIRIK
jgi:hypothetical protein